MKSKLDRLYDAKRSQPTEETAAPVAEEEPQFQLRDAYQHLLAKAMEKQENDRSSKKNLASFSMRNRSPSKHTLQLEQFNRMQERNKRKHKLLTSHTSGKIASSCLHGGDNRQKISELKQKLQIEVN